MDSERYARSHGTTAIVTGASSGIGLVTAHELAARCATVVLACRNVEAAAAAAASVHGSTRVEALDLASQASIKGFGGAVDRTP